MHKGRSFLAVGVLAAMTIFLAGCGGGGGSSNIDYGPVEGPGGSKVIHRSLENETDMFVDVELRINDRQFLDVVTIRPRSYINVVIEDLDWRDWVRYDAEFENGATTSGTFAEDGRTIFTHRSGGRAAGEVSAVQMNGKDAVRPGGETKTYSAKAVKK